jgi:predicted dehydrogenase/threonine dehydrogenase-like Zn-dependent dehydrogenase
MRQLLQNVSTGEITVEEVPAPQDGPGSLLVSTRYSLISAGTERAVLEVGRSSLLGKARARPDLVRKVIDSAREEGLASTYAKVRGRLGEPNALGYSLAGTVLSACADAPAAPGELVACAGVGYASHAEVVAVPRNLCARVPAGVPPEDAAYSTVASIALHGVRLSGVGLGDVAAVIGLGLVGQLTLELLAAAGCVAVGLDPNEQRVALAREAGFFATADERELQSEVERLTDRRGADGTLITAASRSAAPLASATAVARERSVVCVVGDVKIESPRAPLFAKELNLVVSRSYGPGRYDPTYEEQGIDYPAGYVRWTEGRNLAEVLRLMAAGHLHPSRLTTHTFDLDDGARAYTLLEGGAEPSLGILLRYRGAQESGPRSVRLPSTRRVRRATGTGNGRAIRVAVVGAGAFARGVLMPSLARDCEIVAIANATGVSARAAAERFGAATASTDPSAVIDDPGVDAVVIATRHDTHAPLVTHALQSGKHVFVEKPLALNEQELEEIARAAADAEGVLMVGFNRRFSALGRRLAGALSGSGPLLATYRVNAGRLPREHWTHDLDVGGGRVVGEVCHFVDFLSFICGGPPTSADAAAVGGGSEIREDNVAATLRFGNGSVGVVVYGAFGDPSLEKERIEVLGEAGAGTLEDFRRLTLHRGGSSERIESKRDKGHADEIAAFLSACRTGMQPWPVEEMLEVTRATFAIRDALGSTAPPCLAEAS